MKTIYVVTDVCTEEGIHYNLRAFMLESKARAYIDHLRKEERDSDVIMAGDYIVEELEMEE